MKLGEMYFLPFQIETIGAIDERSIEHSFEFKHQVDQKTWASLMELLADCQNDKPLHLDRSRIRFKAYYNHCVLIIDCNGVAEVSGQHQRKLKSLGEFEDFIDQIKRRDKD